MASPAAPEKEPPIPSLAHILIWLIVIAAGAGVAARPFRWPEAVWAVSGALALVAFGLVSASDARAAAVRGTDVYAFLVGMMLLSETARREGLFDAAAALAVNLARGSPRRLFALIYVVGVVVTVFLSNDATAVVLTPAVFAAARKAGAEPLPHLFVCALVANAASFVLPISNPANLVLYDGHLPPLGEWLARFGAPSVLAIAATYALLAWAERRGLKGRCAEKVEPPRVSAGAWTCLAALVVTAVALMTVSGLGLPLGLPTLILGAATAIVVLLRDRASPWRLLGGIAWQIVPLIAGLFVLVEGLARTGVIAHLAALVAAHDAEQPRTTGALAGAIAALASNLTNNLPAGVVASSTALAAHATRAVVDPLLIGIDLGPNLSITGSLATILWLAAIRREGEHVGFWRFLKTGAVVMPPALILALAARLIFR